MSISARSAPVFRSSVCIVLTWSVGVGTAAGQAPVVSGYELAWQDEFNGSTIDANRWNVANTHVTTNNSRQDYLPSQVSVSGGFLNIRAENIASRGLPYRSGLVSSKVAQQYGRWEVRAKLPTSRGMWPAIWLLPDTNSHPWPSQGEIDIMENRGDEPSLTSSAFHYGTHSPFNHQFITRNQQSVAGGKLTNYHSGLNDYAVEWHADQIRFYVNDVHHATIRDAETGGFLSSQTAGMNLIMNTAVGGDFLDNPDSSTVWPQDFSIDHVYAYTIAAEEPVLTFENGFFDARGGSLAHWSTFGNSIGAGVNVRGDNLHLLSGDGSLKLYGQFNGQENYSGVEQGISVRPGDELLAQASAFIASADSIAGTDNYALLKIDYYSTQYAAFGSSDYLGSDSIVLADGTTLNDQWLQRQLVSIVPDGAVEARLALNFVQPGSGGGAVHIDNVSFYVVAIPEPSTFSLLVGLTLVSGTRRRRHSRGRHSQGRSQS